MNILNQAQGDNWTMANGDCGDEKAATTALPPLVMEAFIKANREWLALLNDAFEIADSSARSDVECHCPWTYIKEGDEATSRWHETTRIAPEDAAHIEQALRYLRARGLINIHPTRPELVNFVGDAFPEFEKLGIARKSGGFNHDQVQSDRSVYP